MNRIPDRIPARLPVPLALLALALLTLLPLASAQSAAEEIEALCADAELVIELWHGFTGGAPREALENLTLEYDRANEGAACVRPVGQGGYRDLSTAILAASAAGELPVLAQGFENNIATYLNAGVVADLEALGVDTAGLYPNFLEAVTFDGTLRAVPFNKSVHVLFFDRDLLLDNAAALEAAGIEENLDGVRVPDTVDEFLAAAQALTEATGDPVYWFRPDDLATYEDWFWTLGGGYYDDEGKLTLNSEVGVQALQWLVDLTYEYGVARPITDGSFINQNFGSGTFAFATDTSASYPFYLSAAEFDVGLAPMPGLEEGTPGASVFQGTNLLVFDTASDEEKAAAADYLAFMTRSDVNAVFATATGYAPLSDAAAEDAVFLDYLAETPDFEAIVEQLPYARFEPAIPEWEQIRFDILGQAIVEAVLQEKTPQQALDDAQAAAEALLAGESR